MSQRVISTLMMLAVVAAYLAAPINILAREQINTLIGPKVIQAQEFAQPQALRKTPIYVLHKDLEFTTTSDIATETKTETEEEQRLRLLSQNPTTAIQYAAPTEETNTETEKAVVETPQQKTTPAPAQQGNVAGQTSVAEESVKEVVESVDVGIYTGGEAKPAMASFNIPDAARSFKSWMDYRTITAKNSLQYKLQQSAITDSNGFRRYLSDDGNYYYMIALGTYYTGYQCGKLFRITLDNGESFEAITGDVKADIHTDANNQHRNGNVVEFIVDTRTISDDCSVMGDMSYAGEHFKGKIAKIEAI